MTVMMCLEDKTVAFCFTLLTAHCSEKSVYVSPGLLPNDFDLVFDCPIYNFPQPHPAKNGNRYFSDRIFCYQLIE